jgi:two-component system, NarL family, response regulator DegU
MENEVIKVLIADDHALIRQGLKTIIAYEKDMVLVGEAENGEKVLNMLKSYDPNVVLLDLNMPLINGIKVLEQAKKINKTIKIIVLTVENDKRIIHEAINFGADGYVLKDSAGAEIVDAIRIVYMGEKYIDKSLVSILFFDIKNENQRTNSILDFLSKRELEVLLKISRGASNKEIGKQLFLSDKTVKNYATNLFKKLNAPDRVHATIIAFQNNIEGYYKNKYVSKE